MNALNPLQLCDIVKDAYRNYLLTSFRFKDPEFNKSFAESLSGSNLSKGPFLEYSQPFKKGRFPGEAFSALLGFLPEEAFVKALKADQSLYLHQDRALTKISSGKNVIVSTGTGSGKTESFLLPILLHLYREHMQGTLCPGVRALILYPMNALANDQRDRLGEIASSLEQNGSEFEFSFGQYIGETPEDNDDTFRQAEEKARERRPGELVFRNEMRNTPPHILLTNFSMLEYLLLRPDDSPLFSGTSAKNWTFIVLDEVHQYRGSVGIEMSMLLRRLKQRIREGGGRNAFRCIGTSATIAGGKEGFSSVAEFASTLFGEQFEAADVISGEVEDITGSEAISLSAETFIDFSSQSGNAEELRHRIVSLLEEEDIPFSGDESSEILMGILLSREAHVTKLRKTVNDNPVSVDVLANTLFPDTPENLRREGLNALIECLSSSRNPENGAPFGSLRFHYFLRALEGAFVSYYPEKHVYIERMKSTPQGTVFETAVCRECGQHYFVGRLMHDGKILKLAEASRDPGDADYEVDYFRPVGDKFVDDDEDDLFSEEENGKEERNSYLCPACGAFGEWGPPLCGHDSTRMIRVRRESDSEDSGKDRLYVCKSCGARSSGAPVRDVISGSDAPHAVVATALHSSLPPERRKVLAFADSRQDAAYFAWYLEKTYKDFLRGRLVSEVLESLQHANPEGVSAKDVAFHLVKMLSDAGLFGMNVSRQEKYVECWTWVLKEFFSTSNRISPEGVGLVRWRLCLPENFDIPQEMLAEPFGFSDEEAREIIEFLLDTARRQGAVEFADVTENTVSWQNVGLEIGQRHIVLGKPNGRRTAISWCDSKSRRSNIRKILERRGVSPHDSEGMTDGLLRLVWGAVVDWDTRNAGEETDRIFVPIEGGARVNIRWYRATNEKSRNVYCCDQCHHIQYRNFLGFCERYGCAGSVRVVPSDSLSDNHYRKLYETRLPTKMRVEEHTAQLSHNRARDYQKDFKKGRIHVLSCSTTFELGVDLGDLDTVFLRNVPPESFNYAQRVGRAGRRRGFPGLAITFCRRSPHDLYHFADPINVIRGVIKAPSIRIVNEKILIRHIMGVVLSDFFRHCRDRFGKVERLFGADFLKPTTLEEIRDHIANNLPRLNNALNAILPKEISDRLAVGTTNKWIGEICGVNSRMSDAQSTFVSDMDNIIAFENDATSRRKYDDAKWAQNMQKTIISDDCLSFLSRHAVIPKYGFPVDVVELDTRWSKSRDGEQVQLQRDLSYAIGEFAPTSSVVANKKLWTSHSLKKIVSKEWERRYYKRCTERNCFVQWKEGEPEPDLECGDRPESKMYIIPSFGFVVSNDEKVREPRRKPTRLFSTRPYFAGPCQDSLNHTDVFLFDEKAPFIRLRPAQPGLMSVICEGKKGNAFYICEQCGFGTLSPLKKKRGEKKASHNTHMGKPCSGNMIRCSLGHEFITDVLEVHFLPDVDDGVDLRSLGYSLAYSLSEGAAEALGIPSTDLSTTVGEIFSGKRKIPPILLYDAIPGGAGIVSSLENPAVMKETLKKALLRVNGRCGCDPETSCYGCLRSYRNQFVHGLLQRGIVQVYLSKLLKYMA